MEVSLKLSREEIERLHTITKWAARDGGPLDGFAQEKNFALVAIEGFEKALSYPREEPEHELAMRLSPEQVAAVHSWFPRFVGTAFLILSEAQRLPVGVDQGGGAEVESPAMSESSESNP